ncbi:hypothetical protein OFD51_32145, partial [Escherichia coli]|nr:hypothetical protein [Escherichia coli]
FLTRGLEAIAGGGYLISTYRNLRNLKIAIGISCNRAGEAGRAANAFYRNGCVGDDRTIRVGYRSLNITGGSLAECYRRKAEQQRESP